MDISRYGSCKFGTPWQKPTKIVSWGFPSVSSGSQRCSSKNNQCDRTGIFHDIIIGGTEVPAQPPSGIDELGTGEPGAEQGAQIFKSKVAEPYPEELCEVWSDIILEVYLTSINRSEQQGTVCAAFPVKSSISKPPKEHCLDHFLMHPGCESCR